MPMLRPARTAWPSTVDFVVDRSEQPFGQCLGRGGLLAVGRDHDELVAAEAGEERAARRGLQAR